MLRDIQPPNHGQTVLLNVITFICVIMTSIISNVVQAEVASPSEELGVPVIPNAGKGRHVDSAFMAPDGKHFYTLYEGLLTKFSINPFQKVSSIKIDFKEILSAKNFFKVFITLDEKKLIISNYKAHKVILVDITTGGIVKHILIEAKYHLKNKNVKTSKVFTSKMVDSVLHDSEFLVFKSNNIVVFDAVTMIKKRKLPINWKAGAHLSRVHKVFDKIIYMSLEGVGTIDEKNYRKRELYRYWDEGWSGHCGKLGETRINFDLTSIKNGTLQKFNVCGYPVGINAPFVNKKTIELGFGPISTAGHYVVSDYRYTLENLKNGKKYKIVHFSDGEVVLFDTSSDKNFILTSKARKHLKMKNSAGEIVPMNDDTFNKYQTTNP